MKEVKDMGTGGTGTIKWLDDMSKMDIKTVSIPYDDLFARPTPIPRTDQDALRECLEVMERIKRDDLLCGAGTIRKDARGKIERPLYGCFTRAMDHIKIRLGITRPIKGGIING